MNTQPFLQPSEPPHLEVVEFSHRGLVRENNEDNLLVRSFRTIEKTARPVLLAVLADGVGGHRAGEVASCIAVDSVATAVQACADLQHPEHLLEEAFITANSAIVQQSQQDDSHKGMGTTCVSVLICAEQLYAANIGDSRLYLLRNRELRQLSFDHTWMEELLQAGMAEDVKVSRAHPLAHVLNRYLGSVEPIRVDLRIRARGAATEEEMLASQGMVLEEGDLLMLSSDGISDLLTDEDIRDNLLKRNWDQSAKRMVYCALKAGGHDNASVIIIRVPPKPKKRST
ncbi:MAG: family protein phosphatase [Chloroflexota bacterium]|nr:family protein phosphatase [Chloroflexota bacterium]